MKNSGEDSTRNAKPVALDFSKGKKESRVISFDKHLKSSDKTAKESNAISMYLNHANRLAW